MSLFNNLCYDSYVLCVYLRFVRVPHSILTPSGGPSVPGHSGGATGQGVRCQRAVVPGSGPSPGLQHLLCLPASERPSISSISTAQGSQGCTEQGLGLVAGHKHTFYYESKYLMY